MTSIPTPKPPVADCGACHGTGVDRFDGSACRCGEIRETLFSIKNNRSYFEGGRRGR